MIFYITEETKKELLKKIEDLTFLVKEETNPFFSSDLNAKLTTYKDILNNSKTLPTYESWNSFYMGTDGVTYVAECLDGVIIKNK